MNVSNRLPVQVVRRRGRETIKESPGGLVRALSAVMRRRGGVWIGWPGANGDIDIGRLLAQDGTDLGYTVRAVCMNKRERDRFYKGFANEIIWPLFHDLHTYCSFEPAYWDAYQKINERFARATADVLQDDDLVWVHDYHLMLVARDLARMGITRPTGFYLHIPFPSPDLFQKLPWRDDVLDALLHYRLIGLQTPHDMANFMQTVRALRPSVTIRRLEDRFEIDLGDRAVRVGAFPIGIDADELGEALRDEHVVRRARNLRQRLGERSFLLGVDRLDYTKGLPERLRAFEHALATEPGLRGQVTLIQHVAPSREDVGRYPELKTEVEGLVGRINGRFGTLDWTPVQYLYNYLTYHELVALYRVADVALVTSLKDGQNLVSKEYCAAHAEGDGVLVLSEFAGSADSLADGALLVNPHDIEGTAAAIRRAVHMGPDERRERMRRLARTVQERDVFWWVDTFLDALTTRPRPLVPVREPPEPLAVAR